MPASELLHLNGRSWVLPGPTNIGLVEREGGVLLIDTGNDKESGRRINKILAERGWALKGIVSTHSNADHIGGNDYLQQMTGCPLYASRAEKAFIESPEIEKCFLWGGFPPRDLDNKFFEAKPSLVTQVVGEGSADLEGMAIVALPGHFFGMIGVLTDDGVLYLGDCMFGERTLEKYKIPFVYDVGAYKATISKVAAIPARYYVMSHGEVEADLGPIAARNLALVESVERDIEGMLGEGMSFEAILAAVCDQYGIALDVGQYALVGSTIRSFLSYLYNEGRITLAIRGNVMYWVRNTTG